MVEIITSTMECEEVLYVNYQNLKHIRDSIEAVESMLKQPERFSREELLSDVKTLVDNMRRHVLDAESEYISF